MLERRRRRTAPQRRIRLRSLLECILQRGIGIGADERRDAAGEDRYRERRTRPIRQGDLVGAADEVDATICEVREAARNRYPLDGERRSRERPLERVRDAIAERDRVPLGLSRCSAIRHRRRISAIAECDPVGIHDAVERGRWAWRLRHLRLCIAGSHRRSVRSCERQRDCGECCQRAGDRERAHATSSDEQMVWFCHVRSPFAFHAACATAAACAVARRFTRNRGATNSQMSQPSPITSMPPMTAWTPDAYSAYTLYAMPTTLIAIVRV